MWQEMKKSVFGLVFVSKKMYLCRQITLRKHSSWTHLNSLSPSIANTVRADNEIEQLKARKKHWWDDFCNFYRQFNSMNRRSSEEGVRLTSMQLYHAEAKILRELAEQESCIIIGRSAFHIFRHNPNAWKVLLIANDEHRIRHLTQKYGITAEEASRRMTDADEARENYTLTFASTSRYDARLYDLVCNVSNLDPDHVANFLADLARRRFGL